MNIGEATAVNLLLETLDQGNPAAYSDDVVLAAALLSRKAYTALSAGPGMTIAWSQRESEIRQSRRKR